MTEYRMIDTKRPDGCYVQFVRVIMDDDCQDRPDEHGDGFWPSKDENDAGYVLPENFDTEMEKAQDRMDAWEAGDWNYIGIQARALVMVVRNGVGTMLDFKSAGLWGTESDSGEEYLGEIFAEECEALKDIISALANPIYETKQAEARS